jgi:ribonuclease PH
MAAHGAIDDAYLDGFRWAMVTCALLCLSSAGISAITIRGRET